MSKIMLVQPWNYHDENITYHDLTQEWRNGPYSLLLLATILRNNNHQVCVVDMERDLIANKGNTLIIFEEFKKTIRCFKPDIIGFSFFSVNYYEVKKAVQAARDECKQIGISPVFIAGGIHASIEPESTINELDFDYTFIGEADIGLVKLADGQDPETIPGVFSSDSIERSKGQIIRDLDTLPFPDWSFCDYRFYAYPTFGKMKFRKTQTLDMIMGRGCINRCSFCAYGKVSCVKYYSAEYIVEQIQYMIKYFDINGIYFLDSSVGNNKKLLEEFCELMLRRDIANRIEWLANLRSNQVDEALLTLMWRAGCRYLLYGFESGSQRILDLMSKGISVEDNYNIANLHNKLKFPYHASMILGYPGEREEDLMKTIEFISNVRPPSVGINWYIPLPGSRDYYQLKDNGIIKLDDPWEWRRIGETNNSKVYADIPDEKFRKMFNEVEKLAYGIIPQETVSLWGTE